MFFIIIDNQLKAKVTQNVTAIKMAAVLVSFQFSSVTCVELVRCVFQWVLHKHKLALGWRAGWLRVGGRVKGR